MQKTTDEIRKIFLKFFEEKEHTILESSSLIPNENSSLLFTNAGMNQFQNIFLGIEDTSYKRVATSQRCVRAGGKHNDLDQVGYTNRHHTFFEMLGNFSFGDYFKKDAIIFAWSLLTNSNWFNISRKKLWVTVHYNDQETLNIWKYYTNVIKKNIILVKNNTSSNEYDSNNFWSMGKDGPCGFCTEIFFDSERSFSNLLSKTYPENYEKYIEIWNIVFLQFNRLNNGKLIPLKKLFVDTGMGLERISSVLQNVSSNYRIDIFSKILNEIEKIIKIDHKNHTSLYVIADHIRSAVFLISDGVYPHHTGRGYVLRRIIRRAIRHGHILGIKNMFFYKLIDSVIIGMGEIAKEIQEKKILIKNILKKEEKKFIKTLQFGIELLNQEIKFLKKNKKNLLNGKIIFKLHDTFGFPIELTEEICLEKKIKIDKKAFYLEIQKQRTLSKKKATFLEKFKVYDFKNHHCNSFFTGYSSLKEKTKIIDIIVNNKSVKCISNRQPGIIIIEKTPFYSESGGQVGDLGIIKNFSSKFFVFNTKKQNEIIFHIGIMQSGNLKIGDLVFATVNKKIRKEISCNHSATHLLHASLRYLLGKNVIQKGSLIRNDYFRFDFSYFKPLTTIQINRLENIINKKIRENSLIIEKYLTLEKAKKLGAMALFNKKYGDFVRLIQIKNFSLELCSGTHVLRTGKIGFFQCINESSISSGIRRIECITGKYAIENFQKQRNTIIEIAKKLKSNKNNLQYKLDSILKKYSLLKKQIKNLEKEKIKNFYNKLNKKIFIFQGINILISFIEYINYKILYNIANSYKKKFNKIIILLVTKSKKDFFVISLVTKDIVQYINAKKIIHKVNSLINIRGGGNLEIAQAKGFFTNLKSLSDMLENMKIWIQKSISIKN